MKVQNKTADEKKKKKKERNVSEEEPLKVSLKGARGMGQVPGEGEGGRREDKKCKAKG